MRKIVCLLIALVLCLSMAVNAAAAEDLFVPSIGYKDGPDVDSAELKTEASGSEPEKKEDVKPCLVITSILAAEKKSTDITQEERDLLLEVYGKLENGTMEPPLDPKQYVIRELVDISFVQKECVQPGHAHDESLSKPNTTLTLTLDMGIGRNAKVRAMVYVKGSWVEAENLVNNGDGTVTVTFEDIGPVAFFVEIEDEDVPAGSFPVFNPKTGDAFGANLTLWIALAVGSLAGLVVLFVVYRKKVK